LRRIVLLETGLPLVITTLGGMATSMLVTYMITPGEEWGLPDASFFAGLGLGLAVVAALAVSSLALPLMDAATRHDSARFE
jgi:hypothetical protein